jgi:PAS domain S-box-containing protein
MVPRKYRSVESHVNELRAQGTGTKMTIGLRTRLLLPLGAFVLFLGTYAIAFGKTALLAPGWLLALLLLLLGAMATNVEVLVLRPLHSLLQMTQSLAQSGSSEMPVKPPPGQMRELASGLSQLRERMQQFEQERKEESSRRKALEQAVRDLEDRYALIVERANDGIWEWNIEKGTIDFSPRWKAMLGLANTSMLGVEDWKALLHPDEQAAVLRSVENYLSGKASRFDEQYRLRQGDGGYRWVHSRGTAIRHASGSPYRLLVMDNDIHARKQIENALIQAAESLSSVSGEKFFQSLISSLSSILGTRDNLVCLCVGDPPVRARTLAYYSRGQFTENFEYDLAGTSCGAVIDRKEIVYCPTGVCELWPTEKEFDRDSYIGVPMFDSAGKIIGHFACMSGKPMRQDLPHLALFRIFSVRAAAELERMLLRQQLEAKHTVA